MGLSSDIFYRQLPKIELHVHLDTSLSLKNVQGLKPGLTPEAYHRDYVAPQHCRDLADFLRYPEKAIALLQTTENLHLALNQLIREMAEDGVIYAEIRFAPMLHTDQGLSPKEVVGTLCRAALEAEVETGVVTRLLICTLRHFTAEQSLATAQLALDFHDQVVVGLDLAADEGIPLDAHIPAFRYARDNHLPCTAHAGEARGPASVRETLDLLKPSRIGHGVRSIEDSELVTYLKQQRMHLEVCPSSNLQTGIFSKITDHSIDKLYRQGVSLSINTDGRGLTQTTLSREYQLIAEAFGWTEEDFLKTNRKALEASFLSLALKEGISKRLEEGFTSSIR